MSQSQSHSTPSKTPTLLSLPSPILDRICRSVLANSTSGLNRLTQVCKKINTVAEPILWRNVKLDENFEWGVAVAFNSRRWKYIHCLEIVVATNHDRCDPYTGWRLIIGCHALQYLRIHILKSGVDAKSPLAHFPPSLLMLQRWPQLKGLVIKVDSMSFCRCTHCHPGQTLTQGRWPQDIDYSQHPYHEIVCRPGDSFANLESFEYTGNAADLYLLMYQTRRAGFPMSSVKRATLHCKQAIEDGVYSMAATVLPNVEYLEMYTVPGQFCWMSYNFVSFTDLYGMKHLQELRIGYQNPSESWGYIDAESIQDLSLQPDRFDSDWSYATHFRCDLIIQATKRLALHLPVLKKVQITFDSGRDEGLRGLTMKVRRKGSGKINVTGKGFQFDKFGQGPLPWDCSGPGHQYLRLTSPVKY